MSRCAQPTAQPIIFVYNINHISRQVSGMSVTGPTQIETRMLEFRRDLEVLTDDIMVQKHITYGESFILDTESYFELKSDVGQRFNVHPSQIVVVGSGKLGFSIHPQKRYRPFGEESDLDLAIVSDRLFQEFWSTVFQYSTDGGLWNRSHRFKDYLFRGWMRPDYLPPTVQSASQWFEYFRELTASQRFGPYKINAGLYQSWDFLESYQQTAVAQCRDEV